MREPSSQKVRGAEVLVVSVPGARAILPPWGDLPAQHLFSSCELGLEILGNTNEVMGVLFWHSCLT